MKPVVIFRHFPTEGPGYFATFLEKHSIPWRLIAIDRGEAVPDHAGDFSGIALMGGPMSVNDPLPWIEPVCRLIRHAVELDIPVIGHCLGGQLVSRALGGIIGRNPVKEIGWGGIETTGENAESDSLVRHWLAPWLDETGGRGVAFHWHGETFSTPPGATCIVRSADCANQMFVSGPHLAMQCHVEMTPDMIAEWSNAWRAEIEGLSPLPASVQTPEQMQAGIAKCLPPMRRLADQLYSVWIQGLAR